MSTSTPPPPAPAPAPVSAEPQQPALSEPARLINAFIAPRKTFEDLKRKPSWWVPWLVSAVFTILLSVVISQKVDFVHVVQQRIEQSRVAQARMEQLSPAQKDQAIQLQATITKAQYFVRPVFSLIFGLIAAAVLMAVFNFGFAAEVPFSRALAIFFYASLPGIVRSILLSVSLLVSADPSGMDPDLNPIATNPAFFMDRQANKFLYGLASGLDVIAIWVVILTAIGFAVASSNRKLTTSTAITTMFVIYAVLVLLGAGIGAAF